MVVIVGEVRGERAAQLLRRLGWGRMAVDAYFRPYPGEPWGFDNGAFRDWKRGRPFDGDAFLRRLERAVRLGRPYLAVAPDLVAGGTRSLDFSLAWLEGGRLPPDWPWYLAVQDGMGLADVAAVLDRFAGIFLGGTDRFKATAWHWAELARSRGKKFHYARAGTARKVARALLVGADSLDSSFPLWTTGRLAGFARALAAPCQRALWPPAAYSPHPDEFCRQNPAGVFPA